MAKRVIYAGVTTNDGKGDTLKVGAQKINDNFTELYTALGADTGSLSVVSGLVAGAGITVSSQAGLVTVTSKVATDVVLGGVKIGDNLNITEDGVLSANTGNYSLPVATGGTLGGVKVTGADGISISGTGVISVTPYSLPTATSSVLGGIKVGSRLSITDGVLSATDQSYTLPKATDHSLGGVIVDGSTITINGNGVISASSAGDRLTSGNHSLILGSNSDLTIPGLIKPGDSGTSYIDIFDNQVRLQSGSGKTLTFESDGRLTVPDNGFELKTPSVGEGNKNIDLYTNDWASNGVEVYLAHNSHVGIYTDNGTYAWQFDKTGTLTLPNFATQRTTNTIPCTINTVMYTATNNLYNTIKLLVQVEGPENGSGLYTQSCEILAVRGWTGNDVAVTVYAVVHTSVNPLATFTAQWNATTSRLEVLCSATDTGATVYTRAFATEIASYTD